MLACSTAWPSERDLEPADEVADSARDLFRRGRPAQAELILRRALQSPAPTTRVDSLRLAVRAELLAESKWRQVHGSAEAETLAQHAVLLRRALHGDDNAPLAHALATRASVWRNTRESPIVAIAFEAALRMHERHTDGPDSVTADMLIAWGELLRHTNSTVQAVELLERAVAIRRQVFGASHRNVARALTSLASAQASDGATQDALMTHREAITIFERDQPLDSLGLFDVNQDHAARLLASGRGLEAGRFLARALELGPLVIQPYSNETVHLHEEAGRYLLLIGDLKGSRRHFDRCDEIISSKAPALWRGIEGICLLSRSRLEQAEGRLDSALICATRGLEILLDAYVEPKTPAEGRWVALAYDRVGELHALRRELPEAEAALRQAVSWASQQYSPEHAITAQALEKLAAVQMRLGWMISAERSAVRAAGVLSRNVRRDLVAMTEDEALRYRGRGASLALQTLFSLASSNPEPSCVQAAWTALLQDAGLVAAEVAARRRLLHAVRDTQLAALASAVMKVRGQLGRSELRLNQTRERDSLLAAAARLEQALAARYAPFRREMSTPLLTPERVAQGLPADAALVHYVKFLRYDGLPECSSLESGSAASGSLRVGGPATPWYAAFVLASRQADARYIPLGPAQEIEPVLRRWQVVLAAGSVPKSPDWAAGRELRRLVWDPIEAWVAKCRIVLIVPDGLLAVLPFATLPSRGNVPLLEQGPTLHFLNGARDLLAPWSSATSDDALVVGGADYDARPAAVPSMTPATPAFRGRDRACRELAAAPYQPLPGSLDESRRVAREWGARRAGESALLAGAQASESQVRANIAGRALLHFATHGYLVPDSCAHSSAAERWLVPDVRELPLPPGAGETMRRSGILLAGANMPGRDAANDGLLSSADLALLDLERTQLAVLSACETGRGTWVNAEGVVGLRWALMQAGVRTTLTTSHRISDELTLGWMERFYEAWLRQDFGVPEAVRAASRQVRRELLERTGEDRPGAWGAFLSAGDWR